MGCFAQVLKYYEAQARSNNNRGREAACHCLAELVRKLEPTVIQPYLGRIHRTLLTCFKDDSWPVGFYCISFMTFYVCSACLLLLHRCCAVAVLLQQIAPSIGNSPAQAALALMTCASICMCFLVSISRLLYPTSWNASSNCRHITISHLQRLLS